MQEFVEGGLELPATQAERWTSWSDEAELPVLTQPGLGVTTTTVTTITQTGGDWSTGLFDVCDDVSTCKRTRGSGCEKIMTVLTEFPHQRSEQIQFWCFKSVKMFNRNVKIIEARFSLCENS